MADVSQLAGAEIDGWKLEKSIGQGADGIVYAASGVDGRLAAVKLFFPDALQKNGLTEARQRLDIQLSLAGKKHHPHLVEVYGGGECPEHESLFLAMELVPGTSLDKLTGKVPAQHVPELLKQLAGAARYLEEELELFHRDIKPANIVVSDDFSMLTLLDLGVVYRLPDDDDGGRLSGAEFVATLRYSPPEFVWRTEEGSEDGAWRAITFYQIGATLHDLIVGKRLFDGEDQPRARLYDCVKEKTPNIPSTGIEPWLGQLTQACLLKDWRQRLHFLNWESFNGPLQDNGIAVRERQIQLMQATKEEAKLAAARKMSSVTTKSREQELWLLNSGVFLEIRNYLLDSSIFPRFRVAEEFVSEQEYHSTFEFEADANKQFQRPWSVKIKIMISPVALEATDVRFEAVCGDARIAEATWTEMFTVQSAFSNCQRVLLDAAFVLLS
ncbi:serine/threonine protein kinase [Roseateles sp. PN1]|uniref:serine/threonine protein kinase n=1 Tax=Roseateles sp. PN1 TaxID=3137372 RepID=UPI003138F654